jgi:hypothetical protein
VDESTIPSKLLGIKYNFEDMKKVMEKAKA